MSVIINDLSLTMQFKSVEEFLDSLVINTIPLLEIVKNLQMEILKSYSTYDLKVTAIHSLHDLMSMKGYPEITKFKKQLSDLFLEEPFWETDYQYNMESIYHCEFTEEKTGYCLAEALERNIPVLSFEHEKFKGYFISIHKDNSEKKIANFHNKSSLIEVFREIRKINSIEYLLFKYEMKESFGRCLDKNYLMEMIYSEHLSQNDVDNIVDDISKLIELVGKGENPGRLSKTIEGKLKEFRTTLSDAREIRIFYFLKGDQLIFLNGFLKKTKETPTAEKERAKRIMDRIISR